MFTPMTRRALSAAQQEQERLGHAAVEPAHLLLALLKVRSLGIGDMVLGDDPLINVNVAMENHHFS